MKSLLVVKIRCSCALYFQHKQFLDTHIVKRSTDMVTCLCGLKEVTIMGRNPRRLWGRNLSGGGHNPDGDAKNTTAGCRKVG